MDILDIFLNKYSYKFPKGYPDMNNEQDVLLMEGILENLGVDLNEMKLQKGQLLKRTNIDTFLENFFSNTPFKTDSGDVILDTIFDYTKEDKNKQDEIKNKIQNNTGKIKVSGKYIDTGDSFEGITGDLIKTSEFGGKTSARGEEIEAKELAYVNNLIEQNGGKIDIILDKTVYPNITKAEKVPKNKQADFVFIGDKDNNLYIQHKDIVSQQLSGVHKLNLLDVEENLLNVKDLTDNELKIVVKKYTEIQEFVDAVKTKRPNGLKSKDNFSRLISPELQIKAAYGIGGDFGPSKVQAVFFGNLTLKSEQLDNGEKVFRLSSPKYFIFPEQLDDNYEVMINVTFRNNMNQQDVKNARFGFYPKKVYSKTTMIPQEDVDINIDSETP